MRRLISMLSIVAASVVLSGMAAVANDTVMDNAPVKDSCLLVAASCKDNVDSLQMRIERLKMEIAKGTAVYTRDELGTLQKKLDDAHNQLQEIISGG